MRIRLNTASVALEKEKVDKKADDKKKKREASTASLASSSTAVSSGSSETVVDTKKAMSSQAGSISNLLTVDLKNLIEAITVQGGEKDTEMKSYNTQCGIVVTLGKLIATFVILYQVLGWRHVFPLVVLLIF